MTSLKKPKTSILFNLVEDPSLHSVAELTSADLALADPLAGLSATGPEADLQTTEDPLLHPRTHSPQMSEVEGGLLSRMDSQDVAEVRSRNRNFSDI